MNTVLIVLIRAYQMTVSPLFPAACRFQPSCSEYALEALQHYGAVKGSVKAMRRLLRCHPFSKKHGWDPV